MLADVNIDGKHPDDIKAWQRVVLSDRGRVQALATHVENALVYFSDTDTGTIYRTNRNTWDVTELTVQQPHVEGKLVTETALLYINDYLVNAIGSQKLSCLCLLDLSTAFDTIDHSILLARLSSWFGIHGVALKWFKSFSSSRSFRVKCDKIFLHCTLLYAVFPRLCSRSSTFYPLYYPS